MDISNPDSERSRPQLMEFSLAPASGGTEVTITASWFRYRGWRRVVGVLLRPAQRFVIWITLFQVGAALSRAFR